MTLEVTGIHGSMTADTPDATHVKNRIGKGWELFESKETEYLCMLGYTGFHMLKYLDKKYHVSELDKRRIFVEGKGRSTLQEIYYFGEEIIKPNGFKILGSVSNDWHLARIKMIYENLLPNHSVTYIGVEDGRPMEKIKIDTDKEKLVSIIDRYRLKLPASVAASSALETLLDLGKKLYFYARKF